MGVFFLICFIPNKRLNGFVEVLDSPSHTVTLITLFSGKGRLDSVALHNRISSGGREYLTAGNTLFFLRFTFLLYLRKLHAPTNIYTFL